MTFLFRKHRKLNIFLISVHKSKTTLKMKHRKYNFLTIITFRFVSFYDLVLLWTVSFPPMESPGPSPSVVDADVPSKSDSPMTSSSESNNPYHLTLLPTIGIVVTAVSLTMLVVLVILIRRKNRELDESESLDRKSAKTLPSPRPVFKIHQGEEKTTCVLSLH